MSKALVLLCCLEMMGCAPAFIAQLDSSATLTRQMTPLATIGPFNIGGSNSTVTNIRFFPLKPTATATSLPNEQSGFLVTENGGYDILQFAYMDSSGNGQITGYAQFPLTGADPNYPLYDYDVTTTTTTGNMVVFYFNPSTPSQSTVDLYAATLPGGPLTPTVSSAQLLTSIYSSAPLLLGEQMAPTPGTADFFNWLLSTGGNPLTEGSLQLSGGTTVFTSTSAMVSEPWLVLPAANRFLYYTNQAYTLSYASWFSGSQWVCYRWASSVSPVILPGVTHRIDAILTTGDLLSTEGGILRLYDPNGSPVLGVALGGLQFCYEAYVGTTPYVFFSLPLSLQHGDWAFRVYAVPTSSMRSLGG